MKPVATVSGNDSGTYFFIAAVLLIELVQLTEIVQFIFILLKLCVLDGQLVNLFLEFLILLQDNSQFSKLVHTNGYPSADAADAILKRNNDIAHQFIQRRRRIICKKGDCHECHTDTG